VRRQPSKARVEVSTTRDTLLEDHIGKVVVCHLGSRVIRGRLRRVSRYEIELEVGDRLVVLFKHALTHVSILSISP